MVFRIRVTLTGIKGFFRIYLVNGALDVQGLEHDELVLREFHIGPHLLMEGVQRRSAVHVVDSEETLDPCQGHSESEYHSRSQVLFLNSKIQ